MEKSANLAKYTNYFVENSKKIQITKLALKIVDGLSPSVISHFLLQTYKCLKHIYALGTCTFVDRTIHL